ncbi:MAG TPA: hypothetical protein VF913_14250 [Xanthobacteraceae bacterium]
MIASRRTLDQALPPSWDRRRGYGFATQFVAAQRFDGRHGLAVSITDKFQDRFRALIRLVALDSLRTKPFAEEHEMSRRWLPFIGTAAGLSVFGLAPAANAGCGGWGCQPGCEGPAWFGPPFVHGSILPCAPLYPLRPVYRVEQGPIHNVVVVPYEEPHLRLGYLPRRFFADCACYR